MGVHEPATGSLWPWPLRDARGVTIRRVHGDDGPLLDAFVKALSPASRQRRFHVGIRELPPAWLERLTHPDDRHELAMLAIANEGAGEVCVGEARYVLSDGLDAGREFALAVADGWQGRGLGRALLRELTCHASRAGVDLLVGDVLRDNLPMLELARSMGFAVKRHPQDPHLVRAQRALPVQAGEALAPCAPLPQAERAWRVQLSA